MVVAVKYSNVALAVDGELEQGDAAIADHPEGRGPPLLGMVADEVTRPAAPGNVTAPGLLTSSATRF
jgi:hypothetical protein